MSLFKRVLYVLLAIAFVFLCYYVIVWVLGMLGVQVPEQILRVVMVILGLLAVIGAISGRFDDFWTPKA
jgi:uncharacterized membrane protein